LKATAHQLAIHARLLTDPFVATLKDEALALLAVLPR